MANARHDTCIVQYKVANQKGYALSDRARVRAAEKPGSGITKSRRIVGLAGRSVLRSEWLFGASLRVDSGSWLVCSDLGYQGERRVLGPGDYLVLMGLLGRGIESARQVWPLSTVPWEGGYPCRVAGITP